MTTSLDTNILVALWNVDEAQNLAVKKALVGSQAAGKLLICGAVYAELLASPMRNEGFVDAFCAEARIAVEWELKDAAVRSSERRTCKTEVLRSPTSDPSASTAFKRSSIPRRAQSWRRGGLQSGPSWTAMLWSLA